MKGGTAINLFLRDMPRLSVDLDLVFTDHRAERNEAIQAISTGLEGPHLQHLPAIRWKLENLAKLKRTNPSKFKRQSDETVRRLWE